MSPAGSSASISSGRGPPATPPGRASRTSEPSFGACRVGCFSRHPGAPAAKAPPDPFSETAMPKFKTLDDLDLAGKTVLLRVDFNVPMAGGRVTDRTRLERAAPTVQDLTKKGARVLLLSHFGRPKGKPNPEMSLRPLVPEIDGVLGRRSAEHTSELQSTMRLSYAVF